MTDESESRSSVEEHTAPKGIERIFALSEPAVARLAPACLAERVTQAILAQADRRQQRLRHVLAGLMFGVLGSGGWLLAAFGPELLAQLNAAMALTGPVPVAGGDSLSLALILACAALCAVFARFRAAT